MVQNVGNQTVLVGSKGDFAVYFNAGTQQYTVKRNGNFFAGGFYKFSQAQPYIK